MTDPLTPILLAVDIASTHSKGPKTPVGLTLEEAQHLALTALQRTGSPPVALVASHIERPFGWVFFAALADQEPGHADPGRSPILLVNKFSRQVLLTSTAFFVQSCVDTYEALLKAYGRDWCLTLEIHPSWPKAPGFSKRFVKNELEKVGLCDITPYQESGGV
jgi:hypothetical protein